MYPFFYTVGINQIISPEPFFSMYVQIESEKKNVDGNKINFLGFIISIYC